MVKSGLWCGWNQLIRVIDLRVLGYCIGSVRHLSLQHTCIRICYRAQTSEWVDPDLFCVNSFHPNHIFQAWNKDVMDLYDLLSSPKYIFRRIEALNSALLELLSLFPIGLFTTCVQNLHFSRCDVNDIYDVK